jgi:shikimate kinase
MPPALPLHVVITGLMGSGKSTVGPLVAAALHRRWSDSDVTIEAQEGRTGRDVAVADGVPVLHEMEAAHLLTELARTAPAVISAASSVLDDVVCLEELERSASTFFLDVAPALLEARQASGEHRRRLAAPLATLTGMRSSRIQAIRAIGGVVVGCGGVLPEQVAAMVVQALPTS